MVFSDARLTCSFFLCRLLSPSYHPLIPPLLPPFIPPRIPLLSFVILRSANLNFVILTWTKTPYVDYKKNDHAPSIFFEIELNLTIDFMFFWFHKKKPSQVILGIHNFEEIIKLKVANRGIFLAAKFIVTQQNEFLCYMICFWNQLPCGTHKQLNKNRKTQCWYKMRILLFLA